MSDDRLIPTYIARERCGCIVEAIVDDGKHPEHVKKSLKEWIDDNLIIERVTVGYVRDHGLELCSEHALKAEEK